MVLGRNVAPNIVHPLLFSLNAFALGRQDAIAQTLCEHRSRCDFVHPFDAFGEDLSVDGMLEVSRVDLGWLERVGAGDVDTSTGQRML